MGSKGKQEDWAWEPSGWNIFPADGYASMRCRGGVYYPDRGPDRYDRADMRYMKELYPELARRIQKMAEKECSRLEYEGSMMYDEYPDRIMIYRIVQRIWEKLQAEADLEADEKGRNIRVEELIRVILLNEIFKRRAERRERRKRYW